MSITDRDRKILLLLVPLLVIGVYWFLLLAPQREQAASLGDELAQVEGEKLAAESDLALAEAAKANASRDYAAVVRLGKAIPTTVDTPSLIVQLDAAADGTGIEFEKITTGERVAGATAAPATPDDAPAAEAGGEPAGTGAGQAVEAANEVAADGSTTAGAVASPAGGLDTVPLEFTFRGSFFDLADFFHQLKRFVRATDGQVDVHGRLMTIDGFSLDAGETFPDITAEVTSTVYLSPLAGAAGGIGQPPTGVTAPTPVADAPVSESSPSPTSPPISTATPR